MRTLWLVGLAALVSLGSAQPRTQRGATQQDDGRIPIAQAAQELAQKFKVQIVVDPALTLRVAPSQADTLERALDEITAQRARSSGARCIPIKCWARSQMRSRFSALSARSSTSN